MSGRMLLIAVSAALTASAAVGDNATSPDRRAAYDAAVASDDDLIQGTWYVTAVEVGGKYIIQGAAFDQFKAFAPTFRGHAVSSRGGPTDKGVFVLHPGDKPTAMHLIQVADDGQVGTTLKVLFDVKSEVLRLCVGRDPTYEPARFHSKDGQTIIILKRSKWSFS